MKNSFKTTEAVTVMIFHRYCNSLLISQIRNTPAKGSKKLRFSSLAGAFT